MIVIVLGLPGSGKSYFASRLARTLGADYINSDRLRKEILIKRTYSEIEKHVVYERMLVMAKEAMKQKRNLVLDATFYLDDLRKTFIDAGSASDGIVIIEVTANETITWNRLQKKRTDSEADFEVYKKIKLQWEPVLQPHLVLESTNNNIEEMLYKTADYLHLINDKGTNT